MQDLESGSAAMKAVLNRANAAIEKMKKEQEVQELLMRVDDWKGHKIEHFGNLITFGAHTVLKGDSGKEEREVSYCRLRFSFHAPSESLTASLHCYSAMSLLSITIVNSAARV